MKQQQSKRERRKQDRERLEAELLADVLEHLGQHGVLPVGMVITVCDDPSCLRH